MNSIVKRPNDDIVSSDVNSFLMLTHVLPSCVATSFIMPYAFDNLSQALNLMLVCKKWYAATKQDVFWRPFVDSNWKKAIDVLSVICADNEPKRLLKVMATLHVPFPPNLFQADGYKAVILSSLFPAQRYGYRFVNFDVALKKFGKDALGMVQGMFSGYGMELWTGKRLFCGAISDGLAHGPGILYAENRRVEGNWKKGILEGLIMSYFSNGSWCKGNYLNGHYNGLCTYRNQEMYFTIQSIFAKSQFNGPGILTYDNGVVLQGEFFKDRLTRTCTVKWPDGDYYQGIFVMGKRIGKGILFKSTGEVHQQEWIDGDDTYRLDGGTIHVENGKKGVFPPKFPPSMNTE